MTALNGVRVGFTLFVVILLVVVILGWRWTATHQPPSQRTASHVVLAISAFGAVFALAKIWRR
jgi:hypothetical protein